MKVIKSVWQSIGYMMAIALANVLFWTLPALADSNANEIRVSMGNINGELTFFPNNIQLQTGQPYQLLVN